MIVADSSVWIDFFRGTQSAATAALKLSLDTATLVIPDLVLTEVLQGFRDDAAFRRASALFAPLPIEPIVGQEAAREAAVIYRKLRRAGITPRSTIDVLIASHCVRQNHELLHTDRDFDRMAEVIGLRTIRF